MGARYKLCLSEAEREALIVLRDNGSAAYLRERAAALLKIAEGFSAQQVALSGLSEVRHPDTVRAWFRRYESQGIAGLEYSAAVVRHTLCLSEVERSELIALRDKGSPAYVRERAGALLKIAGGCSPHEVAKRGLLKRRKADTVCAWLSRYKAEGIAGLYYRPGRGRKPAYCPKSAEEAESEVYQTIAQGPERFNVAQTRWTLSSLGRVISWLDGVSVPGIHYLLRRIGISYKRAREYMRSPDTDYVKKMERVEEVLEAARQTPETVVALYQDEFAFDRQPTVAKDWAKTGTKTPLARQSFQSKQAIYGMGAMDAYTGRVVYHQVPSCTVLAHHQFYTAICAQYPAAERIYMIQDNRPLHFHPNLMAALLPQVVSFVKPAPPSWKGKLSKKIGELPKLPIELIQLPTYAPWTNPIEKLWRWVRQSVLHVHRLAEEWEVLQQKVLDFMAQFRDGSQELLRYVGLAPD